MTCSIIFFLLIRRSKVLAAKNELVYDSASIVFMIELCKLSFSVVVILIREGKFLPISVFRQKSWRVGIYYAVPSGIYAVYNNLTFFNLSGFDPGTYQVFMQTRVLFTGLLYTWFLNRTFSKAKWMALGFLSLGVMIKYITPNMKIDAYVFIILFQALLSSLTGVYNEFLLKRDISMDVNESNFFMYSFALLFNLVIGMCTNPEYYSSGRVIANSGNTLLIAIILAGAGMGIATSFILKFINVIVKSFASACEVMLTAVLAALFLGETFTKQDFFACCIVMGSIYIYYTNK
eukprot:Tbor_TRINITY_DN5405_c1_g1::TRINITY_DN5405_c1_g1_i1::g.24107::m.24107